MKGQNRLISPLFLIWLLFVFSFLTSKRCSHSHPSHSRGHRRLDKLFQADDFSRTTSKPGHHIHTPLTWLTCSIDPRSLLKPAEAKHTLAAIQRQVTEFRELWHSFIHDIKYAFVVEGFGVRLFAEKIPKRVR